MARRTHVALLIAITLFAVALVAPRGPAATDNIAGDARGDAIADMGSKSEAAVLSAKPSSRSERLSASVRSLRSGALLLAAAMAALLGLTAAAAFRRRPSPITRIAAPARRTTPPRAPPALLPSTP